MSAKSIHHDCDGSIVEWPNPKLTTDVNLHNCPRHAFDLIPVQELTNVPVSDNRKSLWWKSTKLSNSNIAVTFFCNEPPVVKADPNCPICHGEGGYYEDVCGDGGSRMWQECECQLELEPESNLELIQENDND